MLEEARLKQLHALIDNYSREELVWINGYLSGIVAGSHQKGNADNAAPVATRKISLVYGTETGNSKRLAMQLASVAKKQGVNAKLTGLDQYRITDLPKEEYFFIVISTQGEGDPPVPAKKFYDYIHENNLSLPSLKYSVLALGDSAYPQFCKTGEDVDQRFRVFGAKPIVPLRKCDIDYEADALAWFDDVLTLVAANPGQPAAVQAPTPALAKKATTRKYYEGSILQNINLNDRGSNKSTYHIEIGTDEEIAYEPGDTIGIVPANRKEVVDRIISLTGIDQEKILQTSKFTATVRDLLTAHLNICYLLTNTVKKYASIIGQAIPDTRMDLVDLLRIYPVKDAAQFEEVLSILVPIAPRLYSVASSPEAHGLNEVHITVAKDHFMAQDEQRFGLCSEFLGDKPAGSPITFYVHNDKSFKLPAPEKDVIMIGPGTGVAPFRAFLAHRDATGANGRNWFFFGEQHFVTDFLYQTEMQAFAETGVLTRLDLAFSRDQQQKIYVQHKMEQHASELFAWIENGASVYVSGTKDPMSKDVEDALVSIIAREGKFSTDDARIYLETLAKDKRYAKDVY